MNDKRAQLERLFLAGVDAVRGFSAVQNCLKSAPQERPDIIIAVGKAAGDMALGARRFFGEPIETIVVTKYGHVSADLTALPACEIYEAAHPIPDKNSLMAGERLLDVVANQPAKTKLMLLVSGGASALVEALQPGITLEQLIALNKSFLADGLDIASINSERKKLSRVKAGQLLDAFSGTSAQVIAISDVEGDSIDVIASGIGAYHGTNDEIKITIAASNAVARMAAETAAIANGLSVIVNEETLYKSAEDAADHIHECVVKGESGLCIFGGEPTVLLPKNPGRGGRNQHLALLLADRFQGRNDTTLLVAGTDGTDGPTQEAGAIIDGTTINADDNCQHYLKNADAGSCLASKDALLTTGPTGTNVMDLVIALKS